MPREIIPKNSERKGPPEVYCTLRDLIGLQFKALGFSFLPRFAVQSILAGRHRSKLRGRGLDFEEVRRYVPGDDIRNIHWKATARTKTTYTKVFTEERERPVLVLTDQSSSMFFGSVQYLKSVVAAHLSAVAAWRVIDVGDRVGGIIFNDHEVNYVRPKRDRRAVQRLLSIITDYNQQLERKVEPEGAGTKLDEALQMAAEVCTHDFLVLLISDFSKISSKSIKLVSRIRKNNDVIAFQVTDPMDTAFPDERLILSDSVHQVLLDSRDRARTTFSTESKKKQMELENNLKRYGIPMIKISTVEPTVSQLRKAIGSRRRGKR